VRWEPDLAGTSHRTMVVYKETQSTTKLDPAPNEWTGTFRDARPLNPRGAAPENELTGTIFTVNAWRNDFLEVPSDFGLLRFWRNTSLATLPAGSTHLVPVPGLLGHEWDEDVDNGFRPAGLIRLSETTVDNVQYLQDEGATFDTGTATHHLTLYRHPESGALVFGAGTVQWSWGLDGHHDLVTGLDLKLGQNCYSLRVGVDQMVRDGNRDIQQATLNLLADMGVAPASPQSDLVPQAASSDRLPPRAVGEVAAVRRKGTSGDEAAYLEGSAADEGGGRLAAVEVMIEGEPAWHPATSLDLRTGRWTYALRGDAGPQVRLRLGDDSGNIAEQTVRVVMG